MQDACPVRFLHHGDGAIGLQHGLKPDLCCLMCPAVKGNLKDTGVRIPGCEQKIAEAVEHKGIAAPFRPLQNMRMVSDDEIGTRVSHCLHTAGLPPALLLLFFRAPVNVDHDDITVLLCLLDYPEEICIVPAAENPRAVLRRPSGIRVIHLLDLRGAQNSHLHSSAVEDRRLLCLREISSGTDMRHVHGIQSIKGVEQRGFPVVIGMIIAERDKINAHVAEPLCRIRRCPERIGLSSDRRPPCTVREFIVQHEHIRILHHLPHRVIKAGADSSAVPRRRSNRIIPVKQNISCKSKCDQPVRACHGEPVRVSLSFSISPKSCLRVVRSAASLLRSIRLL